MPAFSGAAEITYFIKPEYTGKGIGRDLLQHLIAEGKKSKVKNILANISSLNQGSINFHLQNGFEECGRLKKIGEKNGKTFDVVYCQKKI